MDIRTLIRRIGVTKITRTAGLKSTQAVSQWDRIPAEHVVRLEPLFLEYGIDRYDMRPDIFGLRQGRAA